MTVVQGIAIATSVIMCVIGIATFISGLLVRARKDGQLEYKVDEALAGIEEIKNTLHTTNTRQQDIRLTIQKHEEKIKTLFETTKELKERVIKLEE